MFKLNILMHKEMEECIQHYLAQGKCKSFLLNYKE